MQEPAPTEQRADVDGRGNVTVQVVGENNRVTIAGAAALRLARHPDASARFWLNLQTRYDLALGEGPLQNA